MMSGERFSKDFVHSRTESSPIFFSELKIKTTELNERERRFDAMKNKGRDFWTPRRAKQIKRAGTASEDKIACTEKVSVPLLHRSARLFTRTNRARSGLGKQRQPEPNYSDSATSQVISYNASNPVSLDDDEKLLAATASLLNRSARLSNGRARRGSMQHNPHNSIPLHDCEKFSSNSTITTQVVPSQPPDALPLSGHESTPAMAVENASPSHSHATQDTIKKAEANVGGPEELSEDNTATLSVDAVQNEDDNQGNGINLDGSDMDTIVTTHHARRRRMSYVLPTSAVEEAKGGSSPKINAVDIADYRSPSRSSIRLHEYVNSAVNLAS